MVASKTAIANRALSKLGQGRVANIDTTDTKAAKIIRFMWDQVRDALLQAYPWNFAIKRVVLAPTGTDPVYGWDYEYQLPSDCLAILDVRYDVDYVIENQKILTDEGTALYIRYIYRVTNTGLFSSLFDEAFATQLAFEACEEITQSDTKKQLLAGELRSVLDLAYRSDAIEQPPDKLPEDEWLTARE